MKRTLIAAIALIVCATSLPAKDYVRNEKMNSAKDNIVGEYFIVDEDGTSHARFVKASDGTYYCQTYGGKPTYDKNGKLMLDEYNPDPSLRSIPLHEAIIISGLKYNSEKKQWDGGKIHHPLKKMLKSACTVDFVGDGRTLRVFGHIGPIGASRYWTKKN